MKTSISSIPDLIAALDGPTALAKWAGYEDSRGVYNWLGRGIPPSYHLRLALELKRRGLVVSPCVFGLEDEAADVLSQIMGDIKHDRASA